MDGLETINALVNAGTSVIFLWLFWMERKRNVELSDSRIELLRDCMDRLELQHDKESHPPALSDKKPPWD